MNYFSRMQCNSPLKDRVPKAIPEYVRRAIEWTQLDPFLIRLRQEIDKQKKYYFFKNK